MTTGSECHYVIMGGSWMESTDGLSFLGSILFFFFRVLSRQDTIATYVDNDLGVREGGKRRTGVGLPHNGEY